MQGNSLQRKKNAILGALVADAAALGFHWLYDQSRILELAATTPEFRQPTSKDFAGAAGYFAHAGKKAGEFSQYGEQALVMLRSLAANQGLYDKAHYENEFCTHFGYGGQYVGYIDRPTRTTLNNVARAEYSALQRSKSIPSEVDESTRNALTTKVLACVRQYQGPALVQQIETAVRETHDDDALVYYAQSIATEMLDVTGLQGADDDQLPALAKLPALVAQNAGSSELPTQVESAVRVTNNNDLAVQFGLSAAAIIEATIDGADIHAAIAEGSSNTTARVQALIEEAISLRDLDNQAVTARFGMACSLIYGFPNVVHNLVTANSYTDAVRVNILAGGDSCGRSILLGAVLGATHGIGGPQGIPEQWLARLVHREHVDNLLDQLFH